MDDIEPITVRRIAKGRSLIEHAPKRAELSLAALNPRFAGLTMTIELRDAQGYQVRYRVIEQRDPPGSLVLWREQ